MTKIDKLKQKIRNEQTISFDEAEKVLSHLGFKVRSRGSHHIFYKDGYEKNVSIKKRSELLKYQIQLIKEVLDYYEEK